MSSLDEEARELLEQEQAAAAIAAAAAAAAAQQEQERTAASAGNNESSYTNDTTYYSTPVYTNTGSAGDNSAVVSYALSRIGCPYVWAAEGPNAFDCSGLVRWAYLQIGVSLPHYTESLYAAAVKVLHLDSPELGHRRRLPNNALQSSRPSARQSSADVAGRVRLFLSLILFNLLFLFYLYFFYGTEFSVYYKTTDRKSVV